MDKNVQKDFLIRKAWAMNTLLDLRNCNEDLMRDVAYIQDYVINLCKIMDVPRIDDAQITQIQEKGQSKGISLYQLIESGVLIGFFSHECKAAYIDILCCKVFSPLEVEDFTRKTFEAENVSMVYQFKS